LIDRILENALNGEEISKDDFLTLFKLEKHEDLLKLCETATKIRNSRTKHIKLTSTIHITNVCKVTPKCKYCGFAAQTSKDGYCQPFFKRDDEILQAAKVVEKSGIPRISCSGAHGYNGKQAVKAAQIVKENTSLELLVNVGADLNDESMEVLNKYGTNTVCCNLETTNEKLFNHLKPGEKLGDRIKICSMVGRHNMELSSGILIGVGESYEDIVDHMFTLKKFSGLGEVPIMGFNPYKDTPMENHPPCSLMRQMKTIAIARLMFKDLRITVPTPTIGPENIKFSLNAGADNLATVIPEDYPLKVRGVGSPDYGNLKEVVSTIKKMGLKPQLNLGTFNSMENN
jgi:5,10-methenyltetrahydromethanopterin hydrogenase cofactor biosynthesis protein HmdB